MFNAISFDLDGTLLDCKGNVSECTFEKIDEIRLLGVLIIIATGRPPRAAVGLFKERMKPDYLVCYNGGKVYKDNICVFEAFIQEEIVIKIVNFLNVYDSIMYGIEMKDKMYLNQIAATKYDEVSNTLSDVENIEKCSKIIIIGESSLDYSLFINEFGSYCNCIKTNGDHLIEIMPLDVTKLSALNYILELENGKLSEVIAFGDDTNDLEIIENVGYGVAMGNSVKVVKDAADVITGRNNEEGVCNMLTKLLEREQFFSFKL